VSPWRQTIDYLPNSCALPCVTMNLSPSRLLSEDGRYTDAVFYVRAIVYVHERHFAVTVWMSISSMAKFTGDSTLEQLHPNCASTIQCPHPGIGESLASIQLRTDMECQVFDHSNDLDELHNLAADDDWLNNPTADDVKAAYDSAIQNQGHDSLELRLPLNADKVSTHEVDDALLFELSRQAIDPENVKEALTIFLPEKNGSEDLSHFPSAILGIGFLPNVVKQAVFLCIDGSHITVRRTSEYTTINGWNLERSILKTVAQTPLMCCYLRKQQPNAHLIPVRNTGKGMATIAEEKFRKR